MTRMTTMDIHTFAWAGQSVIIKKNTKLSILSISQTDRKVKAAYQATIFEEDTTYYASIDMEVLMFASYELLSI